MTDVRNALTAACRERGITSPADFRARFGVAPASLTPHAALVLVETPAWVTEIWIPNAGSTRVVWVPRAVRAYAAVHGIYQRNDEHDHDFTLRIQATIRCRMEES
jgi:hypothetical protein